MLAALQAQQHPAPRDPLADLARHAAVARRRMDAFRPGPAAPAEPAVRDPRHQA